MLLKNNFYKYKINILKLIEKNKKNIFNYRNKEKKCIKKILKKKIIINKLLEIFCGESKTTKKIKKKNNNIYIKLSDILIINLKNSKKNIKKKIKILKKNIFKNLKKKYFDILIANPPYISYKNKNIKTNLKFESIESLTDFKKGKYFYKKIKSNILIFINIFKFILLEINIKKKKFIKNNILKNFKIIRKC